MPATKKYLNKSQRLVEIINFTYNRSVLEDKEVRTSTSKAAAILRKLDKIEIFWSIDKLYEHFTSRNTFQWNMIIQKIYTRATRCILAETFETDFENGLCPRRLKYLQDIVNKRRIRLKRHISGNRLAKSFLQWTPLDGTWKRERPRGLSPGAVRGINRHHFAIENCAHTFENNLYKLNKTVVNTCRTSTGTRCETVVPEASRYWCPKNIWYGHQIKTLSDNQRSYLMVWLNQESPLT